MIDRNPLTLGIGASTAVFSVVNTVLVVLAAIGVYGLMACSVQQRTQEIGIRRALGAEASAVRNIVVLQGMGLSMAGVVIGVASAFGVSRVLGTLLFGVTTRDPRLPKALTLCVFAVTS